MKSEGFDDSETSVCRVVVVWGGMCSRRQLLHARRQQSLPCLRVLQRTCPFPFLSPCLTCGWCRILPNHPKPVPCSGPCSLSSLCSPLLWCSPIHSSGVRAVNVQKPLSNMCISTTSTVRRRCLVPEALLLCVVLRVCVVVCSHLVVVCCVFSQKCLVARRPMGTPTPRYL